MSTTHSSAYFFINRVLALNEHERERCDFGFSSHPVATQGGSLASISAFIGFEHIYGKGGVIIVVHAVQQTSQHLPHPCDGNGLSNAAR